MYIYKTLFPMNLLTVHFCKQFRYCFYNSINNTIRRYNHASNKEYNNDVSPLPQSKQFPDYTILYLLPMATVPYIFNKMKRNYTIFVGATIPICISLQILSFMPSIENLTFMSCNCILTATLHTIGFLCNNTVGAIYIKDEKNKENLKNQKIIISYINYWGRRIDLKTTADNIIPFAEIHTNNSNDYFKTLYVKSLPNQKLKVYLKYGRIVGPSFYNIFG